MDFSLKEAIALAVAILVAAIVIGALLSFSLYTPISNILEGVI